MKRCPSCNRAYSDSVIQCPSCGIELVEDSVSCNTDNVSNSQETSSVETRAQKVVNSSEKNKKASSSGWKITSAILLLGVIVFAGLYVSQISEFDDLSVRYNQKFQEYNELEAKYKEQEEKYKELEDLQKAKVQELESLTKKYEQQKKMIESYDLDGQYIIDVTAVYNGTEEYRRLSGGLLGMISIANTLSKESLDCVCVEWDIRDLTKSWDDLLYVDVITPSGEIFLPKTENNNHTWKIDLSDTTGDKHGRKAWFQEGTWKSGTYRIIFYQGNRAIDSFEVKVS